MDAGITPGFVVHDVEEAYAVDLKQLRHLLADFHRYDVDGNGWISRDEFEQVLKETIYADEAPPKAAAQLFDFFDADGDGCIVYLEFVQAMTLLSGGRDGTHALDADMGQTGQRADQQTVCVDNIQVLPRGSGYHRGQQLELAEFRELAERHPEVVPAAFMPGSQQSP
eukprot:606614-Amphidinium_carterae.1